MSNITCYLHTRRKEWCLTQEELADLTGSYRKRIGALEKGKMQPSAAELVAFGFIFNRTAPELFPSYVECVQDAVMAAASRLSERVENDATAKGRRKRHLIQEMLNRVTSYIDYV